MRNLLWLGQPYFAESLLECGWENVHIEPVSEYKIHSWDSLIAKAGFIPDVFVAADQSLPPFVLGMEEFPCLTVFYSIDDHIHTWHSLYAQGFDAALISLKDYLPGFRGQGLGEERLWWSPPFAKNSDKPLPGVEKTWDCLFVGNVNSELMPKRAAFMTALQKELPSLHIMRGDYSQLFAKGKILLNHADAGDLNFRVFEALGCGGCLLTPRIKNGLTDLFVDGEHLVEYVPEDVGDALYRIRFLLEHPDVAAHIRKAGLEEVDRRHRASHRAWTLTEHLSDLAVQGITEIVDKRIRSAPAIRKRYLRPVYLHWAEELENENIKRDFLAAANGNFKLAGVAGQS